MAHSEAAVYHPGGNVDVDEENASATLGSKTHDSVVFDPEARYGSLENAIPQHVPGYKVYKRRFFGLAQLVLLNIVISWDVRFFIFLFIFFPSFCS